MALSGRFFYYNFIYFGWDFSLPHRVVVVIFYIIISRNKILLYRQHEQRLKEIDK